MTLACAAETNWSPSSTVELYTVPETKFKYASQTICAPCRSCQTVLAATARGLLAALAPILPHLAEDAWQSLPSTYTGIHKSVFLAGWQTPDPQWAAISDETVATASALKAIRDHVNIVSRRPVIVPSLEIQPQSPALVTGHRSRHLQRHTHAS